MAKKSDTLLRHENVYVLDTLSAAFAADGRFDVALRMVEDGLKLAEERGNEKQLRVLESRKQLYESGRRYIRGVTGK